MNSTRFGLFLSVVLLPAIIGCGNDFPGRVDVTGIVDLDGKPLDGASVAFIGDGGGALATATTDKLGGFRVKVAPGNNKVSVSKVDPNATTAMADAPKAEDMLMGTSEQVKKIAQPKAGVPEKYGNPATSNLQFDISAGMKPLSISLSTK